MKHPGTQAKKEQKTPRSNKSWRQVETTPQPKERTVQRTVTPQEEGEGQKREREKAPAMAGGSGGGRRPGRRRTMEEDQPPTRKVKRGGTEMEENPSRRTTEGPRETGKTREIRHRRTSPLRLGETKEKRGTNQKTVKYPRRSHN